MLNLTSFVLYIIVYIFINLGILFFFFNNQFGSVHLLDIAFFLIINATCIIYLHNIGPKKQQDKYIPDYLEFGTSAQDAAYGRKYDYTSIVDTEKDKKNK